MPRPYRAFRLNVSARRTLLFYYLFFLIYYLDTLVFLCGLCYPKTGLVPKYCAVLPICRRRQQEEN